CMFSALLLSVVSPGTRHRTTAGVRSSLPLCGHFRIIRRFFGRVITFITHQFLARVAPIAIGKFVRIALVDHRNLARTSLDVFGGGNSHSVAMKLDVSTTRFLFLHTLELRKPNQVYVQKVTARKSGGKEDFASGRDSGK